MKYIYLWMLLLIISLSSCFEDNTNLDYIHVILPDSVFVTNAKDGKRVACMFDGKITTRYNVQAGEELKLIPEVFYQGDDEIVYEWRFGDDEKKVVSTEKELKYICTETGTLMLMVYRKNAGNAVCCLFNIVISSAFDVGIAILAQDDKGARLDFVQIYTERGVPVNIGGNPTTVTLYHFKPHDDAYSMYNGGRPLNMQEPVKVVNYRGVGVQNILKGFSLIDKQWQNSVTLNADNMQQMVELKDEFVAEPVNFRAKDFVPVGAMSLLLCESGKIYTRVNYDAGNPSTGKFSPLPLEFNDPNDLPDKGPVEVNADQIVPLVSSYNPAALIYEKANKRFLVFAAVGRGLGMNHNIEYSLMANFANPRIIASEEMPHYTDLNNVDKELVCAMQAGDDSKEFLFIFKEAGKYFLQMNTISIASYNIPYSISYAANSCIELSGEIAALLDNAGKSFKCRNGIIYFTSGNVLYSMDKTGQNLTKLFEFPQKDKITFSSVLVSPWYKLEGALTANQIFNGRVFVAAFENGDLKVVQMFISPETNKIDYRFLVDKHYSKGVKDLLYYPYFF